jgi:hypothetical protein
MSSQLASSDEAPVFRMGQSPPLEPMSPLLDMDLTAMFPTCRLQRSSTLHEQHVDSDTDTCPIDLPTPRTPRKALSEYAERVSPPTTVAPSERSKSVLVKEHGTSLDVAHGVVSRTRSAHAGHHQPTPAAITDEPSSAATAPPPDMPIKLDRPRTLRMLVTRAMMSSHGSQDSSLMRRTQSTKPASTTISHTRHRTFKEHFMRRGSQTPNVNGKHAGSVCLCVYVCVAYLHCSPCCVACTRIPVHYNTRTMSRK